MSAVIALVGVVVGALLTGTVDYVVQRQRANETLAKEGAAEERMARSAALVAAMELAEEQAALSAADEGSEIAPRRSPVWLERRELLARHLGPVHAFPVALVFSLVERARDLPPSRRTSEIAAARRLFDFARVDVLLAYAVGKPLPPEDMVNAALVAAGSPPLTGWLRRPA
jgi:hypothetical protein